MAKRSEREKDMQVVYRDSKSGEFITQRQAERKDPATWEREHVPPRSSSHQPQQMILPSPPDHRLVYFCLEEG
jgi:hypothetical protein